MSGGGRQPEVPTHRNDSSRRPNAGFDGPLAGSDHSRTSDCHSFSHGGQPKRDWQKEANKMYEDYVAVCPRSQRTSGNLGNTSPSLGQSNPLMNESRTSLSDTEEEESTYPVEPSENQDQHLRCVFHLFLEEKVESVKIQTERPMLNGHITMNLKFCPEEKHWISPELFVPPDQQDNFRYRYVVKYKEGIGEWLFKKVTFRGGNDEKTLKEAKTRNLNSGRDQYDIFRSPNDKNLMKTIFLGQLFYIKWLYKKLGRGRDLKEMLIECEHVGFGHPSYSVNDVDDFLEWVEESTAKCPSCYQSVYICCLFGQFVHRMRASAEDYCRKLERKAIDRLLLLLEPCSFEALPKSSVTFIKKVAECLFKAGSSAGCLLFIKIFCNLLDLEYVMQVADKLSSKSYTEHQFDGQVPSVLASLNRVKDLNSRNRFCSYVIKHSPSVTCLWNLYDALLQGCPDLFYTLEEEFTSVYLTFTLHQRSRKPDFLQPCFWSAAPGKLKARLASPFCEVLVEQIPSETSFTHERLDSLRSIALDPKLQSADTFCRLIVNVSSHKSVEMVSMILILLKSEAFLTCWHTRFSREEKLKVSWNWIRSQFLGKKPSEQILAVVEASATIRATDAVKSDETLCRALIEHVEQMVLKGNFQSIMDAVAVAQNRSPTILPRLIALLRMAIKKRSGSGDRRSKYRQMVQLLGYDRSREREMILQKVTLDRAQEELLVSIVELVQIQGEGEKHINVEEVLKAMTSYNELWLPLFSAVHPNSTLLQHPTVSVALKALLCLTDEQQRQGLRVEFLVTLKNNEISLLAAYCVLVSSQESSIDQNKIEEWKALLSSECERAKIFCGRFSKVEQTFRFLKKVCEGCVVLSDADSIIDEINKRERVKVNATLKDALDVSYWGTLDKLMGSSETATKVQGSIIFANVAHLCLEENLASSQTAMGELAVSADDLPQHEAAEVLHLLENEGMHQFKEACTSLTDSAKDPKIVDVGALLSGIDSKEALGRELREVTSICGTLVPKRKEEMLQNYLSFPLVCAKVQQLMSIYAALGFEDSKDEAVTKDLQDFMEVSSSPGSDLTLRRVSEIVEKRSVAMVNSELDDTLKTIMETLQMSSELISFMKETANEDIRILIDAVEEHSDQFVSEAIVSDLIDVHGFLRNILRQTPKDPMMFLDSLKKCYRKLEKKSEMAAKIKECGCNVHSLRGLYMNVANRGEMTKEIINNAVQKGCYSITTNSDGSSDVQLSYRRNESAAKETTYSMTELHDLRSRALLILNTDKKQEQVGNSDDSSASFESVNQTLPTFIKQVEMITDIVNIVTLLRESGHPKYESFWQNVTLTSSHDIESQARTLESTLEDWETLLKRLQEQHYFLNFFHPDQLWLLHNFFSKRLTKTQSQLSLTSSVHSLLRFVDPSIQREELDDFRSLYNAPKGNSGLKGDLQAIGKVLDRIFIPRQSMQMEKIPQHDLQRAVKPGDLFVAVLEHGSKQTANVVMSLFESTTGSFPQPSQVLFCHSETSWEEVERLLKRSFEAHSHSTVVKLHCLANVENLSNDMQFELVTAIRTYQKKVEGPYLLALVCCGGIHQHIADQFSTAAHNILGMSEPKLRDTFKENFPNVFMVTSDLPGVGKTEAIHEHAASCKKKDLTLPIRGPLSRKNLLKRLSGLSVSPHECIHFDIGEVDDPLVLDSMMFELVVVGMMSCGTELFHLPTKHVYIEIANTLKHWLQNSLPITKCFSPLHVNLVGYKDLVVSQEPLSPVQVVCQYLHAYESGLLETKDLNPVNLKPLSPNQCKQLLSRHFSSTGDLSYNIVESFLKVFADQLLQFSESPFFKTHNLHAALGPQHDVRNCLFKALLEVSREFASRSVVTCKDVQSEAISKEQASEVLKKLHSSSRNDAKEMVERVEGMIQWADNNHLVIAFHRLEAFTISALYRDLSLVPSNVQKLLKVQAKKG
ncbi:uncharacterized protein LOC111339713 [Stylophora pistillata]|uniref:uncharacterized protein LOC111339713 n=1 Tax=Stylophora pistillata TaxID=50429 RepID=UPI000C04142A|nr:uncharacterized protein LOC111339713 [Stylophora pistillata]